MSIPTELIPKSKPFTGISAYSRQVKWTQGDLTEQNNRATIVLPNEDCASLSSMRLRFRVAVSGTTASPEFSGWSFINRIQFRIGGTTVEDYQDYHLQQSLWSVLDLSGWRSEGPDAYNALVSESDQQPVNRENELVRDYDIPLSLLMGSFFEPKDRALLPLFMLPKCEVIVWTNTDASACTGAPATYVLSNLELGMTVYTSESIKQYFTRTVYDYAFIGVSHRTMVCPQNQQIFNFTIPSNYRSLRAVVAVFRPQGGDGWHRVE